jgi:hypothetical protein
MRKIIIVIALSLFGASSAFAATNAAVVFTDAGKTLHGAASGVGATSPSIGKCSTNVGVGWRTGTTGYAIVTQHQNGTKAYGTSFDSTAVYVKDVTKGTAESAPSASDTSSFSSWKTM